MFGNKNNPHPKFIKFENGLLFALCKDRSRTLRIEKGYMGASLESKTIY